MAEQQAETKIKAPGGFEASFKGHNQIVLLVLLLLAFVIYEGKTYADDIKMGQVEILKNQAAAKEETRGIIWILSKPQSEREALQLERPPVIRAMTK